MHLERRALVLAGRAVSLRDVLAFRHLAGSESEVARSARVALACRELAAERGTKIDKRSLQNALNAWRVERRLLAAEDLDEWLKWHRMRLDDVAEFLCGRLLVARLASDLSPEDVSPENVAGRDLRDVQRRVALDFIASGRLEGLVRRVALPMAAGLLPEDAALRQAKLDELRVEQRVRSRADSEQLAAVFGISPEALDWLFYLEAGFRAVRARVVTREALERELVTNAYGYGTVEWSTAVFPSLDAAREAVLCVRHDGIDLEDLAEQAGAEHWSERALVTDVERGEFPPGLASSERGALFGPLPRAAGWSVSYVRAREDAGVGEEATRIAGARILDRYLRGPAVPAVEFERVEWTGR